MTDEELLTEAVRKGYLRDDQLPDIRRAKQEITSRGLDLSLDQLLILKGYLTREQTTAILTRKPKEQKRFGPYVILEKIGEGAMGIVYKAIRPERPNQAIALKVLHPSAARDEDYNKRLRREAEILNRMKHPHIVRGIEFGEANGRFYIAMEFIPGRVLRHRVLQEGPLSEAAALKLGLDLCRALEFLQPEGLVHRDIKPDNIMLLSDGSAKLMDLGLAKVMSSEAMQLTAPGVPVGTPVYMSPEQVRAEKDLDVRTDIYSLGATLYFALTGRRPFDGDKPTEIINRKLRGATPDVCKVRTDISEGTSLLLQTMMARRREERYASPQELAQEIQRVLDGRPPRRVVVKKPRKRTSDPSPVPPPEPVPIPAPPPVAKKRLGRLLLVALGVAAVAAAGFAASRIF